MFHRYTHCRKPKLNDALTTLETLRYPEIGVRVTVAPCFFYFVVTSSTLRGRTSRFSGVDTSLPVEDLRVAASPT